MEVEYKVLYCGQLGSNSMSVSLLVLEIQPGTSTNIVHEGSLRRLEKFTLSGRPETLRLYGEIDDFEAVSCLESKLSHLAL